MEFNFKPIGVIESCFKFKNGTPRQPTVCGQARATLTINTEVYSNPDQSLIGLDEFSHVWVIFVFHQNNNAYKKAKVKPPRLNGAKVGVFSTRSPYRLNNIGLTLAKIEGIEGASLHLSGIDMLDGTPVLDIKPYIPLYDKPHTTAPPPSGDDENLVQTSELTEITPDGDSHVPEATSLPSNDDVSMDTCDDVTGDLKSGMLLSAPVDDADIQGVVSRKLAAGQSVKKIKSTQNKDKTAVDTKGKGKRANEVNVLDETSGLYLSKDTPSTISTLGGNPSQEITTVAVPSKLGTVADEAEYANWIKKPPYQKLAVRFTQTAEEQLEKFSTTAEEEDCRLKFIKSKDEARTAITNILEADPRSSYRRQKCVDRLYFFMVDVLHITCWFNDDENVAEVVRIKPNREKMMQKLAGQI